MTVLDTVDDSKAWILTYTSKKFYLLSPTPEMVCVEDIAHALSQTCRWTGHTKYHYSVAQHSFYCSLIGPEEEAFDRLMHDASEAYMGDLNRPLKHFTAAGPAYLAQEKVVEEAIAARFGLPKDLPPSVKVADNQMLYAEKNQLMTVTEETKYEARKWNTDETPADIKIEQWTPHQAEYMFLAQFRKLYNPIQ